MNESVRLAKRVAELLACSRREAEQYIEGGWVRVAGEIVETPQFRVTTERIELDPLARLEALQPVTLLLNKPSGYDMTGGENSAQSLLDAAHHDGSDPTGIRPHKTHFRNLRAVTELDTRASGLVVFTQDGRIARKLIDEADSIEHEIIVEVRGQLIPHGLKRLNHGLVYNGRPLPPCKVSWQNETRLRFAIKAARPGQLEHMCARVGLEVVSIKRIRIGRVPMAQLPQGSWRYLDAEERF